METASLQNHQIELPRFSKILKRRFAVALIGAFVVVNALLLFFVDPSSRLASGYDTASWIGPAKALVEYGVFGTADELLTPSATRGPIYPLIVAGLMATGGEQYPNLLAVFQAACLLFASLLTARVAEFYRPGTASIALGLMLFNPNLLGASQVVQAEIVYLVIVVLLLFAVLRWSQTLRLHHAVLLGGLAGLAALTRPEGLFLIVCIPILMIAAVVFRLSFPVPSIGVGRLAASVASCVLASLLVVTPWVARNIAVGIGARINEAGNTAHYVWGAVEEVTRNSKGLAIREASKGVQAERNQLRVEFSKNHPTATLHEIARQDLADGIAAFTTLPARAHLATILQAKIEYLFAGGAGNWIGLLFGADRAPMAAMPLNVATSYLSGWFKAATRYGLFELLITAASLGYVAVVRILDAVGLWRGWRNKTDRLLVFMLLGVIGFFAFALPYYGPSRFRLPAEPAFVLLAILAFKPRDAKVQNSRSRPGAQV